jgi:hypothetical protein
MCFWLQPLELLHYDYHYMHDGQEWKCCSLHKSSSNHWIRLCAPCYSMIFGSQPNYCWQNQYNSIILRTMYPSQLFLQALTIRFHLQMHCSLHYHTKQNLTTWRCLTSLHCYASCLEWNSRGVAPTLTLIDCLKQLECPLLW